MSIEPTGFDSSVTSFASNAGFGSAGLDLVEEGGERVQIRNGFSYYSGEPASRTPGQVSTGSRRRFVILNGQPGPNQWEVLYISSNFSSSQAATVRGIIDSVAPSSGETPQVEVTTAVSPLDGGVVIGGGTVDQDSVVTLAATPNAGFRFVRWDGGNVQGPSNPETTLMANGDVSVTATFVRQWELALGPVEGGTITGGGVFDDGSIVPIVATAAEGYRFDSWSGTGVMDPSSPMTSVSLGSDETVNASFIKVWDLVLSTTEGGTVVGSGIYDEGAVVTISATPLEGFRFAGWIGDGVVNASAATTELTVTSNSTVMANFVTVAGLTVSAGPGGTAVGGGAFDVGTVVSITATPEEGYRFVGWTGEGIADASALVTEVEVMSNGVVMANFVKVWGLAVSAEDGGTVAGAGTYDEGTTVAISATPEDGYRFGSWVGEGVTDPNAATTEISVNAESAVSARFIKVWPLMVTAGDGGTVEGSGTYDDATMVSIVAMPAEGYRFGEWTGEGVVDSTLAATEIGVTAASSASASFVKVWDLTLNAGDGGAVEGAGTYDDGTLVSITATPAEGYRFGAWNGEGVVESTRAATEISVTAASSASASYVKTWNLALSAGEGGSVDGAGTYDEGSVASILAVPAEGYRFGGWTGDGVANPELAASELTVTGDATATANFVKVWSLTVNASEGGMAEGSGTFDAGSEISVSAVAKEGFQFVRWEGSDAIAGPTSPQTTLTLNADASVTAVFVPIEVEPLVPPRIVAFNLSGMDLTLRWTSVSGLTYQLESTDDLAAIDWNPFLSVTADGEETEVAFGLDSGTYFRVRVAEEE